MNDAVDEVFAIHVPCKTAVQIFKKLVAVLECLFKNFFKGQVRGFRTSRISIPWVLFSIHIVLLIGLIVLISLRPVGREKRKAAFNFVS